MVGEGGGEYSRIRTPDLVQDLVEMKDQGSGGVTPSPAEGEVSLCLLAVQLLMDSSALAYISQFSILS